MKCPHFQAINATLPVGRRLSYVTAVSLFMSGVSEMFVLQINYEMKFAFFRQ